MKNYSLIIFDADQVSLASKSGRRQDPSTGLGVFAHTDFPWLTNIGQTIQSLRNRILRPKLAMIANCGLVTARWASLNRGLVNADNYPDFATAESRLKFVAKQIGVKDRHIYMALSHREGFNWLPVPPNYGRDKRFSRSWVKPQPGMIRAAMADTNTTLDKVLVVGHDRYSHEAAKAAGVEFVFGSEFFGAQVGTMTETVFA